MGDSTDSTEWRRRKGRVILKKPTIVYIDDENGTLLPDSTWRGHQRGARTNAAKSGKEILLPTRGLCARYRYRDLDEDDMIRLLRLFDKKQPETESKKLILYWRYGPADGAAEESCRVRSESESADSHVDEEEEILEEDDVSSDDDGEHDLELNDASEEEEEEGKNDVAVTKESERPRRAARSKVNYAIDTVWSDDEDEGHVCKQ
eukprot:jgi/Picre1/32849/NNA_008178.t1